MNQGHVAGAMCALDSLAVDARQVELPQARAFERTPDYAFDSRSQVAADAVRQAMPG